MCKISKTIDGFERYIIDMNGRIYDTKYKKFVCEWIDTVGYYQCILRNNNNKNVINVYIDC